MITFHHSGNFSHLEKFLMRMSDGAYMKVLDKYGKRGVEALAAATPVDSGKTAGSWGYEIQNGPDGAVIYWTNSNENDGVNIAVILQYGHGTGTGGYVQGRDYINPALRDIFDSIADEAWKEVTSS